MFNLNVVLLRSLNNSLNHIHHGLCLLRDDYCSSFSDILETSNAKTASKRSWTKDFTKDICRFVNGLSPPMRNCFSQSELPKMSEFSVSVFWQYEVLNLEPKLLQTGDHRYVILFQEVHEMRHLLTLVKTKHWNADLSPCRICKNIFGE